MKCRLLFRITCNFFEGEEEEGCTAKERDRGGGGGG